VSRRTTARGLPTTGPARTVAPATLVQSRKPKPRDWRSWVASIRVRHEWWFPLCAFAVTRLADALFIVAAGHHQIALRGDDPGYHLNYPSTAAPGYRVVASNWDGQWYQLIATSGYPRELPVTADGKVSMNSWAFYPLYPFAVGALMRLTSLPFTSVAPTLSILLGAAGSIVLYRLLGGAVSRFTASATTLAMCTFMAAPSLQLAYTESLALLLTCVCLIQLRARRYAGFAVTVLALGLCRPIALALVPVVSVHWLSRHRDRAASAFPSTDRWRGAALIPWCIAVSGLWPLIAGTVTGERSAYLQTMSAWGTYESSVPVVGWLVLMKSALGVAGVVLFVALGALVACIVLRPAARAWGVELRTWAWAYPAFLSTATAPGPSIARYLLLAFPLMWPIPDLLPSVWSARLQRVALPAVVIGGLLLQWLWIRHFVVISATPIRGPFP
jgi:hypothetical protein